MYVVGVVLGAQVVPEDSAARLHAFSSPLAMAYVLPGKRNMVKPELRTIRLRSPERGFANQHQLCSVLRITYWMICSI